MRNRKQEGFTLIELLIVIAIIGILAAVLIPNLLSARQRAYDTSAQSCAKAIATGQEIAQIDTRTYVAVTEINATSGATTPALEGTNSCVGITLVGSPTGDANGYSVTVTHPQARNNWTVTQNGITSVAKN